MAGVIGCEDIADCSYQTIPGTGEEVLAQEQAMSDEAERLSEEADFSSTEVVPAPAASEMTADELRAALDRCVEGADDWRDFEPVFGLSFQSESSGEGEVWPHLVRLACRHQAGPHDLDVAVITCRGVP